MGSHFMVCVCLCLYIYRVISNKTLTWLRGLSAAVNLIMVCYLSLLQEKQKGFYATTLGKHILVTIFIC